MDSRETAPTSSTHLRRTAPAKAHVCDDHVVQEGPDVLGSEREPREPLPRWVRLLAVGCHRPGCCRVGGRAALSPPPARTGCTDPIAYRCGSGRRRRSLRPPRSGRNGLVRAAGQRVERRAGRVGDRPSVQHRPSPCHRVVPSCRRPRPRRASSSGLRRADGVRRCGWSTGDHAAPGPGSGRRPGDRDERLRSPRLHRRGDDSSAAASRGPPRGGATHTDAIFFQQDTGLGSSWCGRSPAISLERIGPLTVTVDRGRRTIDLEVGLLNPNAEPIQLAGIDSPSQGVRVLVDNLHGRAVPAGGVVTATARFLVERCGSVFVDGPWSLPAIALGAVPARPVRLSTSPWQLAAVRTLCPTRHPLRQARDPAVLEVTPGGVGSGPSEGGIARLELAMQVLNAGRRALVLTRREVPVPGAVLTAGSVQAGDGGQGVVEPLTRFSLPAGASATVTLTYDASSNLTDDCGRPPPTVGLPRWPSPMPPVDLRLRSSPAGCPMWARDDRLVAAVPSVRLSAAAVAPGSGPAVPGRRQSVAVERKSPDAHPLRPSGVAQRYRRGRHRCRSDCRPGDVGVAAVQPDIPRTGGFAAVDPGLLSRRRQRRTGRGELPGGGPHRRTGPLAGRPARLRLPLADHPRRLRSSERCDTSGLHKACSVSPGRAGGRLRPTRPQEDP